MLGRGGARAAPFKYSPKAGWLNRGRPRFGWTRGKSGNRDVLSWRGPPFGKHKDVPGVSVPVGANPVRDGTAAGLAGAALNRAAGGGGCDCEE